MEASLRTLQAMSHRMAPALSSESSTSRGSGRRSARRPGRRGAARRPLQRPGGVAREAAAGAGEGAGDAQGTGGAPGGGAFRGLKISLKRAFWSLRGVCGRPLRRCRSPFGTASTSIRRRESAPPHPAGSRRRAMRRCRLRPARNATRFHAF